jgi:hypothetical protein
MTVKRYDVFHSNEDTWMGQDDAGPYVQFEDYQTSADYIATLERALFEYVQLGNGKCIISAKHVALGRAALAAKP